MKEKKIDDVVDDFPVRGSRSLFEIYQTSNVVVLEPIEFEEAEKDDKWINAMKKEMKMIGKKLLMGGSGETSTRATYRDQMGL